MMGFGRQRLSALTAVIAVVVGSLVFSGAGSAEAAAAPVGGVGGIVPMVAGQPGIPSEPEVLYQEDFGNVQGRPLTSVIPLQTYQSVQNVTYTADPFWLDTSACNGFILNWQSIRPGGYCGNDPNQFGDTLAKTYALGLLNNPQNPTTNWAVSSNTSAIGPDGARMFVSSLLDVPANGRFITFSVDSAATACQAIQPKLRFSLMTAGGQAIPVSDGPINPCTNPNGQTTTVSAPGTSTQTVWYGNFAADSSILFNSNQLGISMTNDEGNGGGNDGAFDNIRVLDVTPQLDKSFSGGNFIPNGIPDVPVDDISTLTFTVTNTSELAAKSGWSFTDRLAEGLVVAGDGNIGGSCAATTTTQTVTVGASSVDEIVVTDGSLAAGEVSCTITVEVTSDTPKGSQPSPKVYTNTNEENITSLVGLNPPAPASVEFYSMPDLSIVKTSDAGQESRNGDVVNYEVQVTNTGTQDYTDGYPALVSDDLSAVLDDAVYNDDAEVEFSGPSTGTAPVLNGTVLEWSGPLTAGETVTFRYSVTLNGLGDGSVINNACVSDFGPGPGGPGGGPGGGAGGGGGGGGEFAPADIGVFAVGDCATTQTDIARLSIDKSADHTEIPADGEQVQYTVVVTNEGPGDFTVDSPATATDDLSEILDDATFDDASLTSDTGTVTRDGDALSWTGALAAGASATITYTVTYTGGGDNVLRNQACVPASDVAPGFLPCDTVRIPGASLQQWKTAAPSSTPTVAGSTITYTLFFDNDGEAAATIDAIDDLTHVLDDAAVTVEPTSADGLTVVRDGARIAITGSVPAGERYTVTYTVTVLPDDERGDSIATNFLLAPGETPPTDPECVPDPDFPNCTTTPIAGVEYTKTVSASETPVVEGTELTYTVRVRNTGATVVDVVRDDDLADVLDDATLTGGPESDTSSVTVTGPADDILAIRGDLAVGATATITYTVTVNAAADRGNGSANNFLVTPGTTPPTTCDPETEQCTVTPIQGYTVSKTTDTATAQLGSTVTYTVTVVNTGSVAFTDADPATFTDDLTAVLDDASYNGDVTAGGSVAGNTLTWSGALAVGETVAVTYSVTVNDPATGDGTLTNAVVPTTPGGECDPAGDCVVETPVASFTVAKSADAATAFPGDVVTYTVTVTNTGQAAYAAEAPASFSDDLSAVLDDATYNGDVSAGGSVTDATLTWAGPLGVGETIEVTYSVTVNDPITGDKRLLNTVTPTAPGGTCAPGSECSTTTPIGSYTVAKEASSATVLPGGVVTYTVTVTNTSEVAYTEATPATFTDDLSGVLDDATYNGDVSAGGAITGTTLTWAGPLEAGEVLQVTYSVTVDSTVTGDFVLRNAVVPTGPGGSCTGEGDCVTETPISALRVEKTADATTVVPGEAVTYMITVTNTGQVAYTDAAPAAFTDDLSAVLDDAAYNGDAASSAGDVAYDAPVLSWSGALGVGESVTVTYSVSVNDPATGDQQLDNAVVTPPGIGGNCEPGSTDPACVENIPSGSFSIEKSVDPATALPGDVVTYTVTVTNTGDVAYTEDEPASFSDDLSRVLDDASYNSDVSQGGAVEGTILTWSGDLAVGEVLQVTYSVTVDDPITGDFSLRNVVSPTAPGGECVEGGCVTDTPIAAYTVDKSADVADTVLGGVVTYSITVTNTGQVDYTDAAPATFTDDLSGVIDDATYNGDASGGATVDGETLSWSGAVPVGDTLTVTYSVTVNDPATGDGVLRNAVLADGPGGGCAAEGDCVTETPVASYRVIKTVSSEAASVGDRVTFTITVANTGQVDYTDERPASFTDDLTSTLAIATYNDDATNGAVYDAPVLSWTGDLGIGDVAAITYSVTVTKPGTIENIVVTPDATGANCAVGSDDPNCRTETTVTPPLAITGGQLWTAGVVGGAGLLALGLWLAVRRRRDSILSMTPLE